MSTDAAKPESPASMRVADPEIQAMARVDTIFADLPPASRSRVAHWILSRYEINLVLFQPPITLPGAP